MKTIAQTSSRLAGHVQSHPSASPPARGPQPARRGSFWPGEGFAVAQRPYDLAAAFGEYAFLLPELTGGHGSRTH